MQQVGELGDGGGQRDGHGCNDDDYEDEDEDR